MSFSETSFENFSESIFVAFKSSVSYSDDSVISAGFDALYALVTNFVCAHFGLQVIGGNLGGSNQHAVFTGILQFNAAVE